MKGLKPIDVKLIHELVRDSHRSDRQIAKTLGVSQPTVTRRRTMLEQTYLDGYTVLPKLDQLGYELLSITCMKTTHKKLKGAEKQETLKRMSEYFARKPNVLMVYEGEGLGCDAVCLSIHRNYAEYAEFTREARAELADAVSEVQSFHVSLKNAAAIKPLHLKYLAEQPQT
jgi:DNA-binding Lrp family transcriptional regulator